MNSTEGTVKLLALAFVHSSKDTAFLPLCWIPGGRHLRPYVKRLIAEPSVMLGFQQVAAYAKQVIDRAVGGKKSLRMAL